MSRNMDTNLERDFEADFDQIIVQFPFAWAAETTSHKFDNTALREFLSHHGVYDQGLWKLESNLQCMKIEYGNLSFNDYVLPSESFVLESEPEKDLALISCWADYYSWRGFRMDSPIAVLLQWPLTCNYILKQHFSKDVESHHITDLRRLVIHFIGAEKEACLAATFLELQYLITDTQIDIYFIGPQIPKAYHGRTTSSGRVSVTLCHGLYHNCISNIAAPTIAIGFNAGLPAYTDWIDTIKLLQQRHIPTYFTDYSLDSYQFSKVQIEEFFHKSHSAQLSFTSSNSQISVELSEPSVNPFRSPLRIWSNDSNDYIFSNAIVFHLMYSEPSV